MIILFRSKPSQITFQHQRSLTEAIVSVGFKYRSNHGNKKKHM